MVDLFDLKLIMSEEEQETASKEGNPYEVIIIGGGPAGMTSAVYLARKQVPTLLISKDIGGQMLWTSDIENYMGYQYITGKELTEKFKSQMEQFPIVNIIVGDSVEKLSVLDDGSFEVTTSKLRNYYSKAVIIASGKRYKAMNVPGEKEFVGRGISYCATCDAPLFVGKDVMVVGGGNSGITAVIDLKDIANKVYIVNISDRWQADAILLDRIKDATNITAFLKHRVLEIKGDTKVKSVIIESLDTNEKKEIPVQGVFIEIGLIPNSEFAKDIVKTNEWGEIIVDCLCRTSVPGIFAAGDVTTVPEKQISVAIGEGTKAALSAYKYLLTKEQMD